VTTITADTRPALAATRPAERMRRTARRWRYLTNAGAAVLSALLLVWTLTPIYNIVMVSFEAEGDVFSDHLWPPQASANSFWIVVTQGYWYLEYFWHQFGNSVYRRGSDVLCIGDRLADHLFDRPDAHPQRLADH